MPDEHNSAANEVPVKPEPPKEDTDDLQVIEDPSAKDAAEPEKPKQAIEKNKFKQLFDWCLSHKKYSVPAAVIILIAVLLGVPVTRYKLVGLVYKKNFIISAYDASTNTPVSGASVTSGSVQALTDGSGKASLKLPVGPHTFAISKKYYADNTITTTVPILAEKTVPSIALTATGRQVKITVKNIITKKALSEVSIAVSDIKAKTDKDGSATIVLPASLSLEKATLSLSGYNDNPVQVKISNKEVLQNDFTMTPAGKVYFLSKRSGALNLMKANLDGSSPETVLAGTGYESLSATQVSQSADGKYVALITQRSNSDTKPQLYMIAASDDKPLAIDTGKADFSIIGWAGDNLVYTVTRNDINYWQSGQNKLKIYAADTGKTTLLDQSTAVGDSTSYAYELFSNVQILKNTITYTKVWGSYNSQATNLLDNRVSTVNSIDPVGSSHKVLGSYPALDSVQVRQNAPNSIDIWHQEYSSGANHYYEYTVGGSLKSIDTMSSDKFYDGSFGYYLSADMTRSLWAEPVDGKNRIMVGDSLGAGSTKVADVSDYSPIAWFGSDYVLVTKDNSELYVMSAAGSDAFKITNFQPTTIF